jgi:hypothetical protein
VKTNCKLCWTASSASALNLRCDEVPSSFVFNLSLCLYTKAVLAAEAKEGEAEEMATGAGLDPTGHPAANGAGNGSVPEAASVSAAKAVQTMLAGRGYTRSLSAQLERCLTHRNTLHTLHTP